MKKLLFGSLIVICLVGGGTGYLYHRQQQQIAQQQAAAELNHNKVLAAQKRLADEAKAKAAAAAKAAQPFDKQALSLDDPASIWVVVNKLRPLQPKDYAPSDLVVPKIPLRLTATNSEMLLRSPAALALEKMSKAASQDGAHLMVASGYRSYNLQVSVYGNEVKNYGKTTADSESARPGYSEHQSGLAVDLEPASRQCEVADCFADTTEGKWLVAHAAEYGFIKRYPADKAPVTGYRGEAWHYRYVGVDLVNQMKKDSQSTLEEFFGLPAAPDYAP